MEKLTKTKVFITGINSDLIKDFLRKVDFNTYEIWGLSRKKIEIEGCTILTGDLREVSSWITQLRNFDVLIHAAAITHTTNEDDYYAINYKATQQLIDLSLQNGIKKFVFISSRAAHPQAGGYGNAKFLAEEYLKKTHSNYLIFRPAEIFGGFKGEGINPFIEDAIHKTFHPCPVGLEHKLRPIFLDDVVTLLYKMGLEEPSLQNTSITLNGPDAYSLKELILLVGRVWKKRIVILPIPRFVLEMVKVILKITKISISIKPDQIDRLYCPKEFQAINYPFKRLETYLQERKNTN